MVPARPAWQNPCTAAEFFSTALLLGPLFVRAMNVSQPSWTMWAAVAGAVAQLFTQTLKFLWLSHSEQFELRSSARLLSGRLRSQFLARLAILIAAGIILPLVSGTRMATVGAILLALAGEWMGRWLFFVSVVPKNMAAAFIAKEAA
jgi:DMSO reductase anchor subunit